MRYPYHSWNDVDRALEAFKYARRSLLLVMALALPFAAWEAASPTDLTKDEAPGVTQAVKVAPPAPAAPVTLVQPMSACDSAPSIARLGDAAV